MKAVAIDKDICFTCFQTQILFKKLGMEVKEYLSIIKRMSLLLTQALFLLCIKKNGWRRRKLGLRIADAPVSKIVGGATNDTLTFMVGYTKCLF